MTDHWARWLLDHRFGGDPAAYERMWPQLKEFRDNVIRGARIEPGDIVLDVGCGDGLLGVEALAHVGDAGKVIFSDVSVDLLDECRRAITDGRASFVHSGLPGLDALADGSVDVAMTRSVLIYVSDKAASFNALHRVLRPGGRLSVFEPINRFSFPESPSMLWGHDVTGMEEVADRVKLAFGPYAVPSMVDFDERDLLAAAVSAGFEAVSLDYRASYALRCNEQSWAETLRRSPNPLVPRLGEVVAAALSPLESERLATHIETLRPTSPVPSRVATAYLTATSAHG